jgi:large subunit ribosomal protein L10
MPSKKILEAKKEVVASLVAEFKKAKSFVFVDARGLTVLKDTEMRADLRKNNIAYQIFKNTTSILVFKELGIEGLDEMFKGPTAIAYSTEDMLAPAKFMKKYSDKYDKLDLKGGVLEGAAISVEDVNALASIPSKEVLYGQVCYALISPITKLAVALNAIVEKSETANEQPAMAVVAATSESDAAAE